MVSLLESHILVASKEKADEVLKEINEGFAFEEAAFDMQIGNISDPVKTQFGYHIIKLTGRKDAGIKDFNEVKGQLQQQLTDMKQNDTYFTKIDKLKKKYEVIVK